MQIACQFLQATLLVPERHDGIHAHSAARGNVRSGKRDSDLQKHDAEERNRIVNANIKEEAGQETRKNESAGQAKPNADEGQFESLTENHSAHTHELRAERHAEPDSLGALADGIAHHAIDSDRREQKRKRGEDSHQDRGKAARGNGIRDQSIQGPHMGDRQIGIHFVDDVRNTGHDFDGIGIRADYKIGRPSADEIES